MQLIVRVTNRCNFKCTFCSASDLSESTDLPLEKLIKFVSEYEDQVGSIAFEGGDPLCVKPQYYRDFLNWKDNNPKLKNTIVSFTTNLWDFYKRPEKWIDLFNREDVDIGTSFQYGDGRRITDNTPYTEQQFIDVYNKLYQLTGKQAGFIAVIDQTNEHTVLQTAQLAKRLDTSCKINPKFKSGRASTFYQWDKMLVKYAELFEANLDSYELNCGMIKRIILNQPDNIGCPLHSRNCQNDFRVISPDGYVRNCSSDQNSISQTTESIIHLYKNKQFYDVLSNKKRIACTDCVTCDYFRWCNYCRIKINEFQYIENKQQYCNNIKSAIDRITKIVKSRYE